MTNRTIWKLGLFVVTTFQILGTTLLSASAEPASQIAWTGKGSTYGSLNVSVCDEANSPYLDFVLAGPGVTNPLISFDYGKKSVAMTKVKNGTNNSPHKYRYTSGARIDLSSLIGRVVAYYDGTSKPSLTIGTGCLGSSAPADLVGYWNFDDSIRIGHPSIGGIELVAHGSATYTPDGARGGGLYLNGVDSYLSPDTLFTDLPLGNSSYTIAAWIKPDELPDNNFNGIVGWGDYGNALKVNALRLNGSALLNYWWGYDLQGGTVDTLAFHHVCATYDGITRALYIDGALVKDQVTTSTNNATATNFAIGFTAPLYNEYFHGIIDDVAIYKRALSAAEINALKSSGP